MKNLTQIPACLLFLVPLILFSVLPALAQEWSWQNPLPQGNELFEAFTPSQDVFFAVGDQGTVVKTESAGAEWEVQYGAGGTYVSLQSVFMLDDETGWAAG